MALLAASIASAGGFERTLAELAKVPATARAERLTALAGAGTPRVDGRTVTFLVEAREGREPRLPGGFNAWGRYPSAGGLAGGRMHRVPGTDWYYATFEASPRARVEYAFADGYGEPWVDPHNPRTVRTFGQLRSVLEMPDYAPSPWVGGGAELEGRLEPIAPEEVAGSRGRRIQVYLPPGYPGEAPYPVAYFHDGTAYAEELGVPVAIEAQVRARAIRPLIAVFVDPLDRRAEYRGEPAFLDFFVDRLVPHVDRSYRTVASPDGRAILGGSRGALGALHLAWGREGVFGFCGMLAPAITPADLLDRVFGEPPRPLRVHLVGGTYDARFVGDYHRTLDTLLVKGYPVTFEEAPIGHSPNAWRHYIPAMLLDFAGR